MKLVAIVYLVFSTLAFAGEIEIQNAYVRLMPPSSETTGAFMEIQNKSNKDIHLISAESIAADKVELHNHIAEDGLMKMRKVEKILIEANGETVLRPGSMHIMLIGLKKPLVQDQMIKFNLSFDNGAKISIEAPVTKTEPKKSCH